MRHFEGIGSIVTSQYKWLRATNLSTHFTETITVEDQKQFHSGNTLEQYFSGMYVNP